MSPTEQEVEGLYRRIRDAVSEHCGDMSAVAVLSAAMTFATRYAMATLEVSGPEHRDLVRAAILGGVARMDAKVRQHLAN